MSFYIVPTPIGNLNDFSNRSIEVLKSSRIILCEKKTRALKLLNYFEIKPSLLISYHDDKCDKIAPRVIKELQNNMNVSLISDAGTPLISDPGHKIIKILIENQIEPISIPGPSSIISALTLSSLDISNFLYLGFLPKNPQKIEKILDKKLYLGIPIVILASSRELIRLLDILDTNYKQTFLSISKEISKINEGTRRGKIIDIIQYKDHDFFKKGEFVIVLENLVKKDIDSNLEGIETLLKSLKKEGLTLKQSVNVLKKHCKISKKIIYNQALIVWDENS